MIARPVPSQSGPRLRRAAMRLWASLLSAVEQASTVSANEVFPEH